MGRRLGAIALVAMLVRAIVPAGFMLSPVETADGRYLTVAFCEGHGASTRVVDLETGRTLDPSEVPAKPTKTDTSAPCVFAGAGVLAPPVEIAQLVVFPVRHDVEFASRADVRPGLGLTAPPPPSTGPPVLI
jgi:hypothetical protein